jgi:hypothetical protein
MLNYQEWNLTHYSFIIGAYLKFDNSDLDILY